MSKLFCATALVGIVYVAGIAALVSNPFDLSAASASPPDKPPKLVISNVTGGAISVNMLLPLNTGGLSVSAYSLWATSTDFPTVFAEVYRGSGASFSMYQLKFHVEYKLKYQVFTNAVQTDWIRLFWATTNCI